MDADTNKVIRANKTLNQQVPKAKSVRNSSELQVAKKRGVYVEKKHKLTTNSTGKVPPVKKPPPRPGRKTFLASVLTILSKATAGTQYPEEEPKKKKKKMHKYKSKALNKNPSQIDNFEIIQQKKDLIQTPSVYSATSANLNDSDYPIEKDENVGNVVSKIQEEVKDGMNYNPKESAPKDSDKKLYNFFVDLLESTLNVYNETDKASGASSKVNFEIDENVAKKLKVEKPPDEYELNETSNIYYDNDLWQRSFDEPCTQFSAESLQRRKRKMTQLRKKKMPPEIAKPKTKKNKKEDLLNILKEELQMNNYKEPQTMFQALRALAKTKKRSRRLRFETPDGYEDEKFFYEPKITKKPEPKKRPKSSPQGKKFMRQNSVFQSHYNTEEDISDHSLKVRAYDFVSTDDNRMKKPKTVMLPKHSKSHSFSSLGSLN